MWCSLANTDVSDLAFVDQFLEFLPSRIWIGTEVLIQDVVSILLEGDWPESASIKKMHSRQHTL